MVSGGIVDNSVIADGTGSRGKPNVRTLSCALGVASKSPGSGGVEEMNQLEISCDAEESSAPSSASSCSSKTVDSTRGCRRGVRVLRPRLEVDGRTANGVLMVKSVASPKKSFCRVSLPTKSRSFEDVSTPKGI